MKTSTTTIDEVLSELHGLGYQYTTVSSFGTAYTELPDWRVSAVLEVDGPQPVGKGDTPIAAFRACLDAVRAASEVAS